MPLPLIAAALAAGALRTGFGLASNRSNGRRQKGLIHEAYGRGKERLDVRQQDVRQSTGESLNARGLVNGAAVSIGGPVAPGVAVQGGASTLGEAATRDLQYEQGLEQNDLAGQRDAALSDVSAAGKQGIFDAISSGINTATSVYGMGKQMGAMRSPAPSTTPPIAPPAGAGVGTIRGAYGLDPLNPVMPPIRGPENDTQISVGQPNYDFRRMMR